MVGLFTAKLLYVLAIIILSVTCSLAPLLFSKVNLRFQRRVLSLCNTLAGGVFLAAGFVHLLTEASEMAEDLGWGEYPVAGILAVLGFLAIFFIEQVLLAELDEYFAIAHTETELSTINSSTDEEMQPPLDKSISDEADQVEIITSEDPDNTQSIDDNDDFSAPENITEVAKNKKPSSFVSLALVVILSSHSFFTGITMGVQQDITSTTEIFFTIISHKWIESFALGTNLIRNGESIANVVQLSVIYSVALPCGALCGGIVPFFLPSQVTAVATMIATGFGAGSFVYIAIIDILILEFALKTDKLLKFFTLTLGFLCLTSLFIAFDSD